MTQDTTTNARSRDQQQYNQARDLSHGDLLAHAAKTTGRPVLELVKDFRTMARQPSRLNLAEYLRNGLHHPDRADPAMRAQYISNNLHWPITHLCNNQGWTGAAEDKVVAATLLAAAGVAVPETLAVIDRSPRIYPGIDKLTTAEDLRAFLSRNPTGGIFGKIVDGMVSLGAFRVEAADDTHVQCTGLPALTYDTFMTDIVGDNAYVLQRRLDTHSALTPYASALATVRMVNLVQDDGVFCPMAIIKLPQGENIADNFWRGGNLACSINVDSGKIETVARRAGPEVEFLPDHPDTPGLMGMTLPLWDELREMNARAALTFAPIRYQSTDIAITDAGPVVVELNYGGGFDLPQYASGRGLLTPEVRAFFESFGYDFDARPKRRNLLSRLLRRK